jgi:hypothetical protein
MRAQRGISAAKNHNIIRPIDDHRHLAGPKQLRSIAWNDVSSKLSFE